MPIINVPGVGQVKFPDDMSDKDIISAIQNNILKTPKEEPGVKDYLKDLPKAVGRGAVGLLETAGIGASALLPEEYEQKARAGIGSIAAPAQQYLAPSSQEVGESVSSTLASGIGSTAPFFALGPLGLLGRVGAGVLGVAAGAGEARQEAEKAGATPEERSKATLLGAPTGLLDLIAPEIKPLRSIFSTALARGGVEGLTEAAQKTAQNMIAKGLYDPNKDVLAGTAEEGAYGAGVGALTSLLIDVALGRRARGTPSKPGATPEAPAAAATAEAAPEAPPASSLETLPPGAATPDEQAEAYRMLSQMEQDRQARAQQALADQEEMVAQAQRDRLERAPEIARGMPGFTGMPDENAAMMDAIRQRQEDERAAEEERQVAEQLIAEKERQAEIRRIQQTTFSADPVQNQIVKQRLLDQLIDKEAAKLEEAAKPGVVTVTSPTEEPAGLFPKGEPIVKEPQARPRGAKEYKYTPEEKYEITTLKDNLAAVNKEITKAKSEKGNLFKMLEGKLIERPGAFSLNDVAPDDRNLRRLLSKDNKGVLLEDMVSDGLLDDYLPPKNRKMIGRDENPRFDEGAALEHIAEKLRNKDYMSEFSSANIRALEEQRDAYKTDIERLQAVPDVNLALAAKAGRPRVEEVEPLSFDDLVKEAQNNGIDVEALQKDVTSRMPEATPEQFQGSFRGALESGIRARRGEQKEDLFSQEGKVSGNNATTEGMAIQKQLENKDFNGLIQWAINNAPDRFQKLVAQKIKTLAGELQRRGVEMTFNMSTGKSRPVKLSAAAGVTSFLWGKNKSSVEIVLNGEPVVENQFGYPSGMTYDTIQHELLHSVIRTSTKFLPSSNPAIKELNDLYNKVIDQYNKDAKAGTLPPVLQKFYKRINNVLSTPDELISWGITDKDFQDYLSKINVGPKQSAFNKLVELIREILSLPKAFETALERLVRTTDSLLSLDSQVISDAIEAQGYSLGKPQKPAKEERPAKEEKPVGPMTQQSLFAGSEKVAKDDLAVRKNGFYFDAKNSPLYQERSANEAKPVGEKEAMDAIMSTKVGKDVMSRNNQVKDGDYVGLRLDLNILRATGVPVQSVHQGKEGLLEKGAGFFSGEVLKYVPYATLRNVHFKIQQTRRENIAVGKEQKSKMGSADGQFVDAAPNYDGIELRFNPRREHLFRDALGRAVKYADEITTTGNKIFARGNIEYYGEEDVPARAGAAPTEARTMRPGEMTAGVKIDQGTKVSIPQQESLFMRNEAITDDLSKREEGFYIKAEDSPLYQKRKVSDVEHPSMATAQQAIMSTAKGRRIEEKNVDLKPGQYIGSRLDLSILSSTGVPVQALHEGKASTHEHGAGFYGGDVLKYAPYVTMKNVFFKINQPYREKIAGGIKKKPMGSADGQFVRVDNPDFNGVELRFNPRREHLFVDAMGRAVKYAEEITSTGNSVFARGYIEYYGDEDFVQPAGESPTRAIPMQLEKQAQKSARDTGNVSAPIQESLFKSQESWGQRESPDAYGREKTLTRMYNRMRDAYDEGYDIDEAYELAYENATKAEQYILRQLKKDDFLGFDYPHQAIRAIIEDPDAYEMSTGLKVAISRLGNNYITENLAKGAGPQRTQAGEDAMEILSGMGRAVKEPEPGYVAKARQAWDNAVDNPKLAKEQSMGAFRRWTDQFETWAFSSDAALNNQIRREVMDSMKGQEEKIGILLNASLSQTVHSDAVANLFLMKGNVKYDNELHKWVGVDDKSNIFNLSKQLDEIAQKHGLTKEEIELIAHTAFEAKRTKSLIRENETIDSRVAAMRAEARRIRGSSPVAASELSDKASKLLQKRKVIHMTEEDIAAGMSQFELFPELNQVVETWNGIRENALDVMVETGLYSRDEAENLLANADYVPFFREDQIEEGKGPKEFLRSLSVQADKRMKGSKKPVNDIFDNMVRWTQYAVNRGVRNRSALALVDTAGELKLGEKVTGPKDGENVVRVWRNGEQEYHSMADPMFVSAFRGLESVAIPTVKFFSKFADTLRQSVVLFPLFSVSQVTQDSFAAMFSSGLKPQHALSIPFRAVKEFIQTLRGKSSTHEELKNVGAVGVRDFTSAIIRSDVEVLAGLKKDKSLWDKVKRSLGSVAMAADNAVRQATYEAALAQGMSKAEAIEKAFEIFNVRRRGSSQMLAMAGQVIPFFNAYLAAQNVAYRTLTGVGVSPTDRKAALQTLAATTGSVMALSMLYAMMMGDDEDYEKKPTPTRDRMLMIPGSGGLGIPLRADAFLLPKVLAEHTYHLITENGMTDGAKFRASLASLLGNSILSPTVVPQAVKPITEAVLNYDFFQQKPLVGVYQAKKDLSRQFEDSTSEFSKVLGKTELISPIVADHLIRGMFGSFGGLFLQMTNPLIAEMAGVTRPSMTLRDAANAIPNASAFISKEYEVGLRKDFYALKEVTDRAAATLSDMKARSPHEIEAYLSDPEVRQRVAMAPVVNRISNQLTDIRKKVNLITNVETKEMTDDRKEELIKQLREQEYQLLKNVNLRKLREMAQM